MADKISFKSYCWVMGTTSFRTRKMNESIEQQLKLMRDFRNMPENTNIEWWGNDEFQRAYYDFLRAGNFVKGDAPRPAKDAREKTSGLCDIGLLDAERNITNAGRALLDIVANEDFSSDNILQIPKDSYTLLIEATLADGANQRRMEMEPVSRHLGEYCLSNPDTEAYCVFITTHLNKNVISDFRARRNMEYYNSSGTDYITGMKIIPLQTSELKTLIMFEVDYSHIYKMLDKAYNGSGTPKEWYENNIMKALFEKVREK